MTRPGRWPTASSSLVLSRCCSVVGTGDADPLWATASGALGSIKVAGLLTFVEAGGLVFVSAVGLIDFDPDRVVVNEDLSLAGGAIRGWDRKTTYYYQMIQSLAAHYDFDVETPFSELGARLREIILFGSGGEKIAFHYENSRGMQIKKLHRFEGVIPNLERRDRKSTRLNSSHSSVSRMPSSA